MVNVQLAAEMPQYIRETWPIRRESRAQLDIRAPVNWAGTVNMSANETKSTE